MSNQGCRMNNMFMIVTFMSGKTKKKKSVLTSVRLAGGMIRGQGHPTESYACISGCIESSHFRSIGNTNARCFRKHEDAVQAFSVCTHMVLCPKPGQKLKANKYICIFYQYYYFYWISTVFVLGEFYRLHSLGFYRL